ncbi:MAG: hypothetical protein H7Y32_08255, partial [Chloroflexales bacterium]|nr:hypothetical protein [Chloroflexales bacterium]
ATANTSTAPISRAAPSESAGPLSEIERGKKYFIALVIRWLMRGVKRAGIDGVGLVQRLGARELNAARLAGDHGNLIVQFAAQGRL